MIHFLGRHHKLRISAVETILDIVHHLFPRKPKNALGEQSELEYTEIGNSSSNSENMKVRNLRSRPRRNVQTGRTKTGYLELYSLKEHGSHENHAGHIISDCEKLLSTAESIRELQKQYLEQDGGDVHMSNGYPEEVVAETTTAVQSDVQDSDEMSTILERYLENIAEMPSPYEESEDDILDDLLESIIESSKQDP